MNRLALAVGLATLTGCTLELPERSFEATPEGFKCSKGSTKIGISDAVLGLRPFQANIPPISPDRLTLTEDELRQFMADCEAFLSPFASVPRPEENTTPACTPKTNHAPACKLSRSRR